MRQVILMTLVLKTTIVSTLLIGNSFAQNDTLTKINVRSMKYGLEQINHIAPITFSYASADNDTFFRHSGFRCDSVYLYMPDLVHALSTRDSFWSKPAGVDDNSIFVAGIQALRQFYKFYISDSTTIWPIVKRMDDTLQLFKPIAYTGAYTSLMGLPTIPTTTSQLTNNSHFIVGDTGVNSATNKNLIDTASRLRTAINGKAATFSVTTTGVTGAATFNSNTINIPNYGSTATLLFNSSGQINQQLKIWSQVVTPTSATSFNVDISAAGFSTIICVQLTASNNTTTLSSVPIAVEKSHTTTQVSINTLQSNSGVLGILSGLLFAGTLTGITINLTVIGY